MQLHEMDLAPDLLKMCDRIISSLSAKDGGLLRVALIDLLPSDATPEMGRVGPRSFSTRSAIGPSWNCGSRPQECLLLQLTADIPNLQNVRTLINDHMEDLGRNRMPQIEKATGLSMEEIQEAMHELSKLDGAPGSPVC